MHEAHAHLPPDLQGSVVCEDVRQEVNGMQSLVGVLQAIPARALPVGVLKLCVWTRWCGSVGRFRPPPRILDVDDRRVIAESELQFELDGLENHVTNVNLYGGIQFQQFGAHHVEILLDGDLALRYPLPVVKV